MQGDLKMQTLVKEREYLLYLDCYFASGSRKTVEVELECQSVTHFAQKHTTVKKTLTKTLIDLEMRAFSYSHKGNT